MTFLRKCANPKNNPNCKVTIVYLNLEMQELAAKKGSVCTSCRVYGVPKSERHRQRLSESRLGAKVPEETRRKISLKIKGAANPFYGRKHTKESKEKIGKKSRGRFFSKQARAKMSACHLGKPRKPESIRRMIDTRLKTGWSERLSKRMSGSRNPMYGRPSPPGASNAVDGWYKGVHFRSSCELRFLMTHQDICWKSAERGRFRIRYTAPDGEERNYFPDFFGGGFLVEVKPVKWKPGTAYWVGAMEKSSAAVGFAAARGWGYVLVEIRPIDKTKIFRLRRQGIITLSPTWERRYLTWAGTH